MKIDNTINEMAAKLVESETFLRLLREKLGIANSEQTNALNKSANSSIFSGGNDDSSSTEHNGIIGKILESLDNEDCNEEINNSSIKRLLRLNIAKEKQQLQPVKLGEGWKRLKATQLPKNFAKKVYSTTIEGPTVRFTKKMHLTLPP